MREMGEEVRMGKEKKEGNGAGFDLERSLDDGVMPGSIAEILGGVKLRLTQRDYEIFLFLLDQKFATLESLYFRFFDQRKSTNEALPENLAVARQRLGILKRAGLVFTERVYSESKSLYLLSPLGYRFFEGRMPSDAYAGPVKAVDFRNYEHDQAVNYCRVVIERGGKCLKWYSERRIRKLGFIHNGIELPGTIVPDGVFISSKGERVAFEYEGTHRKKTRYAFKMDEYERVLRGRDPLFNQVVFVSGSQRVHEDLKELMGVRSQFMLESYGYFLKKLFPSVEVSKTTNLGQKSGLGAEEK